MEAAAAAPRPRLFLLVLAAAAAATLVPGAAGEQRRGGAGGRPRGARAGPGLWLAPSLSQTWRGAGGAGGGARAGFSWRGCRHASRGRGEEAGRGRVSEHGWTCPAVPGFCFPAEVASGGAVRGWGLPFGEEWARAEGCEGGRHWPSRGCSPPSPLGSCVAWSRAPPPQAGCFEAPGPGAGLGSEVASRAGCEPARSLQGFPEREEGRRAIEVPGSAGSIRPRGAASPARGGLGRGAGKLCVRSRRHGDERNVSFVLLGSVEVSPGTRRLQIVFVVET